MVSTAATDSSGDLVGESTLDVDVPG